MYNKSISPDKKIIERFFEKVEVDHVTNCWLWTGGKSNGGRGRFCFNNEMILAYKFAYAWLIGPIEKNAKTKAICNRANCVNPWHLKLLERPKKTEFFCRSGHKRNSQYEKCQECAKNIVLKWRHINRELHDKARKIREENKLKQKG